MVGVLPSCSSTARSVDDEARSSDGREVTLEREDRLVIPNDPWALVVLSERALPTFVAVRNANGRRPRGGRRKYKRITNENGRELCNLHPFSPASVSQSL